MIFLILLVLFQQLPIPEPVDHTPDVTHKAKHERTEFYAKDGKTLCGHLVEFKSGFYRDYVSDRFSQAFETRAEAEKWLKFLCPVEGKRGTMEK